MATSTYSFLFTTGRAIWLCMRRNSGFFFGDMEDSLFSSCSLLVPNTLSLNGSASSSCSPTSSVIFSSPPEFEFTLDNDPESEMSEQFEF